MRRAGHFQTYIVEIFSHNLAIDFFSYFLYFFASPLKALKKFSNFFRLSPSSLLHTYIQFLFSSNKVLIDQPCATSLPLFCEIKSVETENLSTIFTVTFEKVENGEKAR